MVKHLTGRSSVKVSHCIRDEIFSGVHGVGTYLPTVLDLSEKHKVSPETARKALKILESEALLVSEPGHGFRVTVKANDPWHGCPLACVMSFTWHGRDGWARQLMQNALREACSKRSWCMLAVDTTHLPRKTVLDQLNSSRAFGVVSDPADTKLLSMIHETRLPAVIMDGWTSDPHMDSVMQDGQMAGIQALEWLRDRNRTRIAWFGVLESDNPHSIDRFSGVAAALKISGIAFPEQWQMGVSEDGKEEQALALLEGDPRPDAVIAPWGGCALAIKQAADRLGLVLGEDLDLIGWCVDEHYESEHCSQLGRPAPPALVWSARTMAETALARLAERRETPDLPALRIKIPTRLRTE